MAARPAPLTLTGILASTDSFGRLRLCLVDVLPSQDRPGGRPDGTWARLRAAVPARGGYRVPYDLPLGGAPDDAGIRGECWVTVAGGGPGGGVSSPWPRSCGGARWR